MEYFILWIGFALLVGVLGKDRNIGSGYAFLWAILLSPIIGLVIVLNSDKKKNVNEQHVFKQHLENAKKAVFKGQTGAAIDSYMEALYHLENDYKRLDTKSDKKRQEIVLQVRNKVETLKQNKNEVQNNS